MKTLITITSVLLISLSANANPFEVPTGQYNFKEAKISYLRDVQLFSIADGAGQVRYEDLKKKRYICRQYPGEMVNCYKFLQNTDDVSIPVPEVRKLIPHFGELERSELQYRNRYEIVYTIFQKVELPAGDVPGYNLHIREEGDHFVEIFHNDGTILRYSYETPALLNLLLKRRDYMGDNHWQEYGINAYYEQL